MTMKIVLNDGAFMPERGHDEDAGLDLKTPVDVVVKAGGGAIIDTGVHCEIPYGFFGKLESKSGLNVKHNIVSLGGVIDSGYNGSITVKLYNMGDSDYTFHAGDKVVQMTIQSCLMSVFELADSLPETDRGDNGFGSTGK